MPIERVVLVRGRFPEGDSIGSGSLIGPTLVLTAAHVVFDGDGLVCSEVFIESMVDGQVASGTVLWPLNYIISDEPTDQDAALIDIADNHWVPPRLPPVQWGWLTGRSPGVPCEATGFPRALRGPDGTRDTDHIHGSINPASRRVACRYDIKVLSSVPVRTPDAAGLSPWSGMSGSGLYSSNLLVGVLIIDDLNYDGDRLTAVPAYRLASDPVFAGLVASRQGGLAGMDGLRSVELAGALLESATEFRIRREAQSKLSPAELLRAEEEIVPFRGRSVELDSLFEWCTNAALKRVDVRLVTGPGGQGKTRLARQLARRVVVEASQAGRPMVAGFLTPDPRPPASPTDLSPIADAALPLLLIVDYAEARIGQLGRLLPILESADSSMSVRVLLLARRVGDWWSELMLDHENLQEATITALPSLDTSVASRQAAFDEAIEYFLEYVELPENRELELLQQPADLYSDKYGSPLTLQMSALLTLLQESEVEAAASAGDTAVDTGARDIQPLEARVLYHEKRYWLASSRSFGLDLHIDTLSTLVASATLLGADDQEEALGTLERVSVTGGQSADRKIAIRSWLHDLYPSLGNSYWGSLQPDRLAEHLVGEHARRDPAFLMSLVTGASESQAARALSLLARAREHQAHLHAQLRELLERNQEHLRPLVVSMLSITYSVTSEVVPLRERGDDESSRADAIWNRYLDFPVVLR